MRSVVVWSWILCCWAFLWPTGLHADSGGRLLWDLDDELEFLGDLWIDHSFGAQRHSGAPFFALDLRTSIERTTSEFAFDVREIDYRLETGWRHHVGRSGLSLAALAGQLGKQAVDADGQAYLRYVGLELRSPYFRTTAIDDRRGGWSATLAAVVRERESDADAVLRGSAWLRLPWRGRSWQTRLDGQLDGVLRSGGLDADLRVGPGLRIAMGNAIAADFFLHYQRSRHPLGIGHSAWLAGFGYSRQADGAVAAVRSGAAPQIDGQVAAAVGDRGRLAGQLKMRLLSPALQSWRAALVVDANIVTGKKTGDLFYRYHIGAERPLVRSGGIVGGYFYHRSNHQLAEPNDRITSRNVLEIGLETPHFAQLRRRKHDALLDSFDARLRVGGLIDSSFGEETRWNVRGAARWLPPLPALRLGPYLEFGFEAGDADETVAAVGLLSEAGWEWRVEYRYDEQTFRADRSVWLLGARYGFGARDR